jgi:putative tricarboxylic transport membrane protein
MAGLDPAIPLRSARCPPDRDARVKPAHDGAVFAVMIVRAPKDFWSGMMFVAFAAVAIVTARHYSLGTPGKMGPGYFPIGLGLLLGVLGAILVGRGVAFAGEPAPRLHLGPLAVLTLAVVVFGLAIEPLGLVVAIALLVLLTAWAGPTFRLLETLALAAALVLFSIAVFVWALGLPLPVWPGS